MTFIRKKPLATPFLSLDEIISRETEFSQAMMTEPGFKQNFYEWFEFYHKNQNNMHVYEVNSEWTERVADGMENFYRILIDHLEKQFGLSDEQILAKFPMPGVENDVALEFICYARWTWNQGHRKIGSRFDFAIAENGDVFVYEINADTPSMLFESMNVQNLMSEHLGDTQAQWNEMWEMSKDDPFVNRDSVTAIIGYNAHGEDFGSTESIAQLAAHAGGAVYLSTVNDLQYDYGTVEKSQTCERNPFYLGCLPHVDLDNIYLMLPWEEMCLSNPGAIKDWVKWCNTVRFFEPAWAWLLSHKALFASLTEEGVWNASHSAWSGKAIEVATASYLSADQVPNPEEGVVAKPMIGRKSSAVTITQGSTVVSSHDKTYEDGPMVYQPYRPTIKVDGNRAMGTMWMYGGSSACLSFREFDGDILENSNERVIMHQLVD